MSIVELRQEKEKHFASSTITNLQNFEKHI